MLDVDGRIRGIVHGGSDPIVRVGVMSGFAASEGAGNTNEQEGLSLRAALLGAIH